MDEIKNGGRKKALCLDATGPTGGNQIYSLCVVGAIEHEIPGFLKSIDYLSGASAGSMVACTMASQENLLLGLQASLVASTKSIFKLEFFRTIAFLLGQSALLRTQNLTDIMQENLGDLTLGDLRKRSGKKVIVGTVDLAGDPAMSSFKASEPCMLRNFGKGGHDSEGAIDSVLRSSSFPMLFPIFQNSADGGFNGFNPSLMAMLEIAKHDSPPPDKGNHLDAFNDISMLSLGTYWKPFRMPWQGEHLNWGYYEWMLAHIFTDESPFGRFIDFLFQSDYSAVDYTCAHVLNERYKRVLPIINIEVPPEKLMENFKPSDNGAGTLEFMHSAMHKFMSKEEFAGILSWVREVWFEGQPPVG